MRGWKKQQASDAWVASPKEGWGQLPRMSGEPSSTSRGMAGASWRRRPSAECQAACGGRGTGLGLRFLSSLWHPRGGEEVPDLKGFQHRHDGREEQARSLPRGHTAPGPALRDCS